MTNSNTPGGEAAEQVNPYENLDSFVAGSHSDILPVMGATPAEDVSQETDHVDENEEVGEGRQEEVGSDIDDTDEGKGGDIEQPKPQPKPTAKGGAKAPSPKALVQSYLDKRTGGSVKLGDDVTDENAFEKLEEALTPKQQKHPLIAKLEAAVAKGMDPEQYLEAQSATKGMLKLPDSELLKRHYKSINGRTDTNPDGWDDAQVEAIVSGLGGTVPLEALKVRNAIKQQIAQDQKELENYSSGNRVDVNDPVTIKNFEKNISGALDTITKDGKLYGLDVSKAGTKDALLAEMKKDLMLDPRDGFSTFTRELQSNNEFVELYLLRKMAKAGLIGKSVTEASEKAKAAFLKQLGLTPGKGAGSSAGSGEVDYSGFNQPSGLVSRK